RPRLEQILVQIGRVRVRHPFERSQELDRLVRTESLELRREAVDPAHDLASPSGVLGRRGDESRLHARMTLEVFSVERGFPKDRADLEPLSRDVVDDLATFVRAERPDPLVEDLAVIPA